MHSDSESSSGSEIELQPAQDESPTDAAAPRKRRPLRADEDESDDSSNPPKAEPSQAAQMFNVTDEELYQLVSRYAKVHQPTPFTSVPPKLRFTLEWRNINYKVVIPLPPQNFFIKMLFKLPIPNMLANYLKKKKEVPILNNVSGQVRTGEIIAIMGPTGSGKTTLLNVLARRIKKNITGQVLVNGEDVKGKRFKRRMGYVLQDDIFFPHITVRNTVRDAAYLKLPKAMSWEDKRKRVEDVLSELGLPRCANTIVGGGWVRGVSGGERKRTNIATEMVSNPSLIFLDEPTTGLDAATSLGLVVSLKTLAKSGHTVVTTIHQPSSAMFMMFDKVLLLAEGGWVVYSGSAQGVLPYFNSLGLHAPNHYNPADFMLELVSSQEKVKDGRTVRQLLIDTYAENEKAQNVSIEYSEEERRSVKDMKYGEKYPIPFYQQTWVLANRAFNQRKSEILSWQRSIQILIITLVTSFLWFQTGTAEPDIDSISGFLFFATMFWIMQTWFLALFSFPPERAVLNKERATGTYRLSAYMMGKILAESPLELLLPILFAVITYWIVGLAPNGGCFIFYIVILCLFALMGSGIGTLISAVMLDVKKATTASVVVMLASVLLGGFFISENSLKVWIAWARWLSFMKYCYELLLLNEFQLGNQDFTPSSPSAYTVNPITSSAILAKLNVETNIWGDIIFLVGMIVGTRVLAYLALRFLNKPKL